MNLPSQIENICAAYDHKGNPIKLGKPQKKVLKQIHDAYKNIDSKKRPFTFKEKEIHLKKEGQIIFNELIEYEYSIKDKKKFNYKYELNMHADNTNITRDFEDEDIISTRKSQATFYQIFYYKNKINLKLISFETEEDKKEEENIFPFTLQSGTKVFPLNAYIERESKNEHDCPVFHLPLEKKLTLEEFHHKTYSKRQTSKDQN